MCEWHINETLTALIFRRKEEEEEDEEEQAEV